MKITLDLWCINLNLLFLLGDRLLNRLWFFVLAFVKWKFSFLVWLVVMKNLIYSVTCSDGHYFPNLLADLIRLIWEEISSHHILSYKRLTFFSLEGHHHYWALQVPFIFGVNNMPSITGLYKFSLVSLYTLQH